MHTHSSRPRRIRSDHGQFPRTNTLMMFLESLKTNKNSEIYQNIAHCKMLGRSIKATRLPQHQSLSIGQHIPSRELADQLVDGYMRTCEKLYRILHVPSFRQEYERYWQNPQGAREAFIIQLQLVMAIGAVLYDDKYSLRRSVVRWVYEARFWLLQPSEKSRINLSGLQVWCLVHMARDICGVGSDLVWASAGTLMRMALYTGVHRDPDHLPKMSLLAAETRRRLWATILEILVMSSMESGGPPLISMDDFDTKPPGNYNDEDLVNTLDPSQTPDPKPRATFTDSSVQLALLDSIKVRLDIATYLNQFRSVPTYDRTLVLNADLTAASRNLDALLRIFQTQEPSISPFQLCCAEHIIQRYFLALHFSWVGSSKNDPRYFFSRKMCVEIAVRNQKEGALHGFLGHKNDGPPPDDFGRLLICASGGFRYIGTQCLLVLILELLWELEENREAIRAVRGGGADTSTPALTPASGLPNASPASSVGSSRLPQASSTPGMGVSLLSSIGSNSSGAYGNDMFDVLRRATKWMRARIIAGEVNIKGYLFGCGMLAEAEALQRGLSDEDVLAEVEQAAGHAAADALNILKEMHAEIMGQLSNAGVGGQPGSGADMQVGPMPGPPSMPPATNAPGGSGRLGEPRYTGMEGVQMPMPMPGMSTQGQRYGPMDAGGGNVMTDWDWDVVSCILEMTVFAVLCILTDAHLHSFRIRTTTSTSTSTWVPWMLSLATRYSSERTHRHGPFTLSFAAPTKQMTALITLSCLCRHWPRREFQGSNSDAVKTSSNRPRRAVLDQRHVHDPLASTCRSQIRSCVQVTPKSPRFCYIVSR